MTIINGTGRHKREQGERTKLAILNWFKENPDKTKIDCARALNITFQTVSKHIREMKIYEKSL